MTSQDFTRIVAETKRPVLAAIRRYLDLRLSHAVDDVAQEVYLRAYKALTKGKLRDQTKLRSYLYTIARNEALRMNEKYAREEMKSEKLLVLKRDTEALQQSASSPLERFDKTVVDAIDTLPEHYANVVKLSLLGFTSKEIVSKLAVKPGTVKSRLSRGLQILRQKLA